MRIAQVLRALLLLTTLAVIEKTSAQDDKVEYFPVTNASDPVDWYNMGEAFLN